MLEATERGTRIVRLRVASGTAGTAARAMRRAIAAHGHIPLPPYIERSDMPADAERYQTVFAREEGSVAAPTAGLHFTPELLAELESRGVRRAEVLLHVGVGTFKPVEVEDPAEHAMHEEWYRHAGGCGARAERDARRGGTASAPWARRRCGRSRACSPRARRSRMRRTSAPRSRPRPTAFRGPQRRDPDLHPSSGRPRAADMLVTNFHLPRSTLLMLVAAMAGYDLTMHAYDVAVREGYRFYSYGDAMLVHG